METQSVWRILDSDGAQYLEAITIFLMREFSRIFGLEKMIAEPCVIYNDTNAPCPMLIINQTPIRIRIAQPALNYWAQTIFQLSHELCHYVFRQYKDDKQFTLSWFEEIICEAFSLYALQFASENWSSCSLSDLDPLFNQSIASYLHMELSKKGTDVFSKCTTVEALAEYEENFSCDRDSHRNERNYIYGIIALAPENMTFVCNYMDYLDPNRLTLDFVKWKSESPCRLLDGLHSIQPAGNIYFGDKSILGEGNNEEIS